MPHAGVGKNQHVVPKHFSCGLCVGIVRRLVKRPQRFIDSFVFFFGKTATAFGLDTVIDGLGSNRMRDPPALFRLIQHSVQCRVVCVDGAVMRFAPQLLCAPLAKVTRALTLILATS